MTTVKPLPCPFCGHVGLEFREGSSFRWLLASCGSCGASCGETRIQTTGNGNPLEWADAAKTDAVKQWNERAPATAPPTAAWHDAPTEPGLWFNSINHYAELVSQHWIDRGVVANSHARWYGPIPQDGEKS